MNAKIANTMENGTAIFTDLDNITYTINPAAKQKIAVLVPDWNIPQITKIEVKRKKRRNLPFFVVMAKMINATAAPAALHP